MARGLSRFLRNEQTKPPLTIAITGAWGAGKSSLMNLVRGDLRARGFRPVWFNAWHHQKEEHLLAAQARKVFRAVLGEGTASSAIPTAVAALVLLFMVWRGITAFGVNPADLMATVSGRFKRRALEAKVGFRHEFAQQFRDVTRALQPRTMLILIDDLDRCRPENVLEVLEAVNFLVSSGDCFVIMGMELDRVRRCVGLGFKDVGEELTDREEAETTAETPAIAAERDEGKRRRAVFAQQYLEKLINIEVPVPAPTEVQAARVIVPEAEPDDGPGRWRALGARVAGISRTAAPIAALLVAVVGGFWSAVLVWPPSPPTTLLAQVTRPDTSGSGGSTAVAVPRPVEGAPSREPGEKRLLPSSVVVPGAPATLSRWLMVWPLTGLALAALAAFLRRPPIVVKDSDEFTQALKAWHPLVFSRRSTPRSAKRFLNRVRYYAMRQRDLPEERRIDRLTAWAAARLRRGAAPPATVEAVDVIPECVLVGLSAVEHCHPEWLADARLFKDPEGFLADQPLPPVLKPALSSLGLGRDLLRYREPFAKLSAGIRA